MMFGGDDPIRRELSKKGIDVVDSGWMARDDLKMRAASEGLDIIECQAGDDFLCSVLLSVVGWFLVVMIRKRMPLVLCR